MERPIVAIIDDDSRLRKTLADILAARGFEPRTAASAAEGLALFGGASISLALLDLKLPDMSGLELLARIKSGHPGTEVIILTGHATMESAIDATNKGAFSYIQKPYDMDQLLLHLRHAVEKQAAEEKLRLYQNHLEDLVRQRTRELEAARDAAEAGNRAKSEFILNISHELRTPLTGIMGLSEVLQDEMVGPLNEKQKEYVKGIIGSGRRLLELITNILDYSDARFHGKQLNIAMVRVRDVVREALDAVRQDFERRGIALSEQSGPGGDITIEVDREKILRVLDLLLSNALKFTPEGGAVSVAMGVTGCGEAAESGQAQPAAGACVEITVADTGIGIRPEDVRNLFKEFVQLEPTYTKSYQGAGLGLALVKKLVELHGGTVRVDSRFGEGSRFTIALPVRRP